MSKSLIEQIKELLKHIEINPNALNKFEKDFYFQALKKAKIIDFKTRQTLADEGEPLLPSPAKGKLTGIEGGIQKELKTLQGNDFESHKDIARYSTHPEVHAKVLQNKKLRRSLAYNTNTNPEIQTKLLENADGIVNEILARNSTHPEIQGKLLEINDPVAHEGLAENPNIHPEIQAKLLETNDPVINQYLTKNPNLHPEIKNQLQQKIGKSETYYKDLVESTLEKAKKSKKPFHGYNPKKHAKTGGLNDKYRKKVNRETGSDLKRPSKDKSNSRHKSFCARMKGVKGPTSKEGKLTPKGAALKRWNCSKNEHTDENLCKKDRCWTGYEPTPGKKPYSKGSCRPIKKNDYFSSLIKKTLKHD